MLNLWPTSILGDVAYPRQGLITALLNDLQVTHLLRGGKNKRSCVEFSVEMCLDIRNIFTYFTAHMLTYWNCVSFLFFYVSLSICKTQGCVCIYIQVLLAWKGGNSSRIHENMFASVDFMMFWFGCSGLWDQDTYGGCFGAWHVSFLHRCCLFSGLLDSSWLA